jgi:hypothetical protein
MTIIQCTFPLLLLHVQTLEDNCLKAVAQWHKNIKVFQKKLVFIPVHAESHWLFCVIVNPGLTGNKSSDDEHAL